MDWQAVRLEKALQVLDLVDKEKDAQQTDTFLADALRHPVYKSARRVLETHLFNCIGKAQSPK